MKDKQAAQNHFFIAGFCLLLVIAQIYYSNQNKNREATTTTTATAPADSNAGGNIFVVQPKQ